MRLYQQSNATATPCQSPNYENLGTNRGRRKGTSEVQTPVARTLEARYGPAYEHGFSPLPNSLYSYSQQLHLTAPLRDLIAAILSHAREYCLPAPSRNELAAQLGVTDRTIRRRVHQLGTLGYLRVIPRTDHDGYQITNLYDLAPLFTFLAALDQQKVGEEHQCPPGTPMSPLRRSIYSIDPIMDPPTPNGGTVLSCVSQEHETGAAHEAAMRTMPTTRDVSEAVSSTTPKNILSEGGQADMPVSSIAAALAPLLAQHPAEYPKAVEGQFTNLVAQFSLPVSEVLAALDASLGRLHAQVTADRGVGPIASPFAYLYTVFTQELHACSQPSRPGTALSEPLGESLQHGAKDGAPKAVDASLLATPPPIPCQEFTSLDRVPEDERRVQELMTTLATQAGATRTEGYMARAVKLYQRAGVALEEFAAKMRTAFQETKVCKRVRKTWKNGKANRLPLFFTILERLLVGKKSLRYTFRASDRAPGLQYSQPQEITEAHPVWRGILTELSGVLSPENFARCLATKVLQQEGNELQIGVQSVFEQQWFERCLRRQITHALTDIGQGKYCVTFMVAEAAHGACVVA